MSGQGYCVRCGWPNLFPNRERPCGSCLLADLRSKTCRTHGERLPCYECTVNEALDEAAKGSR